MKQMSAVKMIVRQFSFKEWRNLVAAVLLASAGALTFVLVERWLVRSMTAASFVLLFDTWAIVSAIAIVVLAPTFWWKERHGRGKETRAA